MIASYVILKYGGEPRPQGRPRVGHDEGQHPDRSHQLDSRTDQKRQERSHAQRRPVQGGDHAGACQFFIVYNQ